MKEWKLIRYQPISETSNTSDNVGQTPLLPKYDKIYLNLETAEVKYSNDLIQKKNRRNSIFNSFSNIYSRLYSKNLVSLFSIVVSNDEYDGKMSKFINSFSKKLKRKGIDKLGYVWIRDIGDIKFEKHFHLLFASSFISSKLFKELFSKKSSNQYSVQFIKKINGIKRYIREKELFASHKQRAFGKSKEFLLPFLNV